MEEDIALFMKHCIFLRIPRTRQILREDILHFVQYKNLNVPKMPEDGPGNIEMKFIPTFGLHCLHQFILINI